MYDLQNVAIGYLSGGQRRTTHNIAIQFDDHRARIETEFEEEFLDRCGLDAVTRVAVDDEMHCWVLCDVSLNVNVKGET